MLKRVITFIILVCGLCCFSQSSKDSLRQIWLNEKEPDSSRFKALHDMIFSEYMYSMPDSAYYYSDQGEIYARQKSNKDNIARFLNLKGISHDVRGNFDKAIDNYNKSLAIWEEANDKKGVGNILSNIAIVYRQQGKYDKAIEYFKKSLEIKEATNDEKGIRYVYNGLGNTYMNQGDYKNSIVYLTKFLRLCEQAGDEKRAAIASMNVGLVYKSLKFWDEAIRYFEQSLRKNQEFNNKVEIANNLANLGDVYHKKNDFEKGIQYLNEALSIRKEIDDKSGMVRSYNSLGLIYLDKKEYSKAKTFFNQSYNLGKTIDLKPTIAVSRNGASQICLSYGDSAIAEGNKAYAQKNYDIALRHAQEALSIAQALDIKPQVRDASNTLFKIYKTRKNDSKALEYYELHIKTRDSIESEENRRELIKQEFQFEYEKQVAIDKYEYEKKIAADEAVAAERIKQEKDKQLYLYFGLSILLLLIALIFTRYRLSQQQKKVIQTTLTDLKQTQNQLVQSEKMAALGVLTAGVAHEINNPINFIRGSNDGLKTLTQEISEVLEKLKLLSIDDDKTLNNQKIIAEIKNTTLVEEHLSMLPEFIEGIDIGVDRTAKIVSGLLLYSRNDHTISQNANINEIIDAALLILKNKYKHNIEVVTTLDANLPEINCYPSQLNQVFVNLIDNAIDAIGDKKGLITISTSQKNNQVSISIKDDGKGIPKDIKDKIFDPFYTTKEVGKGTGLGLSICQGIISNHNGTIEVKSEVEIGTEFIITLPIK